MNVKYRFAPVVDANGTVLGYALVSPGQADGCRHALVELLTWACWRQQVTQKVARRRGQAS